VSSPIATVTTISKESPPEERTEGSWVAALAEVVHPWAPIVQWADVQCSSGLYDEDEPSKIWKQERIRYQFEMK
jgi:hypothetical protein